MIGIICAMDQEAEKLRANMEDPSTAVSPGCSMKYVLTSTF